MANATTDSNAIHPNPSTHNRLTMTRLTFITFFDSSNLVRSNWVKSLDF